MCFQPAYKGKALYVSVLVVSSPIVPISLCFLLSSDMSVWHDHITQLNNSFFSIALQREPNPHEHLTVKYKPRMNCSSNSKTEPVWYFSIPKPAVSMSRITPLFPAKFAFYHA